MDHAKIQAVPELTANDIDAALIHEAAIGKIAGEQLIKLMTLGLTEEEAEARDRQRIFKIGKNRTEALKGLGTLARAFRAIERRNDIGEAVG